MAPNLFAGILCFHLYWLKIVFKLQYYSPPIRPIHMFVILLQVIRIILLLVQEWRGVGLLQ